MHLFSSGVLLIVSFLAFGPAVGQAASYRFSKIAVPGAVATFAHAINDHGQIVGGYTSAEWRNLGFLLTQGTFRTLDVPASDSTVAMGINNDGNIVGSFSAGEQTGFLLRKGKSNYKSIHVSVPDSGDICMTRVDSINNRGQMAGHYLDRCDSGNGQHGFVYARGAFAPLKLPNANVSAVTGMNDRGVVVGYYEDAATGAILGFHGTNAGAVTALDGAFPLAVNNEGTMVGYYFDGAGVRGFVSTGTAPEDFTPIDFPGASATFASGINNSGEIVGWYTDETGTHGFVAEPTTLRSPPRRDR